MLWVDREADAFRGECFTLDSHLDLSTEGKLQRHVEGYLEACEARPDYVMKLVEASFDPISWAAERRSLASQLLGEVARLHKAPQEERDWEK